MSPLWHFQGSVLASCSVCLLTIWWEYVIYRCYFLFQSRQHLIKLYCNLILLDEKIFFSQSSVQEIMETWVALQVFMENSFFWFDIIAWLILFLQKSHKGKINSLSQIIGQNKLRCEPDFINNKNIPDCMRQCSLWRPTGHLGHLSGFFYIAGDNDIVSFSRGEVIGGSSGGGSSVLSMVGLRWQPGWNVSDRWDVGKLECWSVVGKQLISAVYKIEVDERDS